MEFAAIIARAKRIAKIIRTRIILTLPLTGEQLHIALVSILANPRWEKFAQLIACGESGAAAYRNIYAARGASAEANASRLIRNDKVRLRIAELREQAAGASAVEQAKTAARVAGKVVLALAKKRALLYGFATARKLKPEQRMRAIELDAKLAGEFVERVNQTVDDKRILSQDRIAELMRASIERRKMSDAPGLH